MGGLGGTVAIIGTGTIKFGENVHQSLSDMIVEAVNLALAEARIESRQLQAAWLGCYERMLYGFEGNSGPVVSDPLILFPIPVTRVAAYCATTPPLEDGHDIRTLQDLLGHRDVSTP